MPYVMQMAHPYCPSVRSLSPNDVKFEVDRKQSFPAEIFFQVQRISAPGFLHMKTNTHVKTGNGMIELDQSN